MPMRKRKIKFALEMKDGEQVRDLEALQEHFDLEKVIGYFQDGKLLEWLRDRFYDDEADAVSKLNGEDSDFGMRLCEIFHVESKGIEVESPEAIAWRNERLEQLKQYTADPEILRQVDVVAFNQDDLEEILHEEDTNVVYLCQNSFTFPSGMLRKRDMRYVGIGKNVEVTVKLADNSSLSDLNISFENVTVHEVCVNTTMNKSTEKADESKERTSEWWKRTDFLSEAIYRLYSKEKDTSSTRSIASWKKLMFLYDATIENIDRYREAVSRLCLQKDETLICIMPASKSTFFNLTPDREMYVAFSNRAVYKVRIENSYVFSVKYSDIVDVISLRQEVKVSAKDGSNDKFPCDRKWRNAMRLFLVLAAGEKQILYANWWELHHMTFDSFDGKTLGEMVNL